MTETLPVMYSLIVPVYKNSESIDALLKVAGDLNEQLGKKLELVFVVDGSPDDSWAQLNSKLPHCTFRSKLVLHSRNFGAFQAIRTGLIHASASYFSVLSADLQEPPELIIDFFRDLEMQTCDVALGYRKSREDPAVKRFFSSIFWLLYRKFVIKEIPPGGVDIFGCNLLVRKQILRLKEANSSLIAQLFWLGFVRKTYPYDRKKRFSGKSAWSFRKRINYLLDSVFSFTDIPIKAFLLVGTAGLAVSIIVAIAALIGKLSGSIQVSGYTALVITISFFGASTILGLGIVGAYAHRTYENSKQRPLSIVMNEVAFPEKEQV